MTVKAPNLRDATLQNIFDFVTKHLFAQNAKSQTSDGLCVFRHYTPEGKCLMCALGPFIPEDKYHSNMERCRFGNLFPCLDLIDDDWGATNSVYKRKYELLSELQYLHDRFLVCNWHLQASKVATKFGLQFT